MTRATAILALVFGLLLAAAETARNQGAWQWWPFWLVDYVASALLVGGAVATWRGAPAAGALLCGAWGFTTAMFYMSFWSHVADQSLPADGNLAQRPLTITIGVLWAITIVGFVLALLAARAEAGARPGRASPGAAGSGR